MWILQVLKQPADIYSGGPAGDKAPLVTIDQGRDYSVRTVCQYFGQNLNVHINKRNWTVSFAFKWVLTGFNRSTIKASRIVRGRIPTSRALL